MKLVEAKSLAEKLMEDHGVKGYLIEFDNAKSRFGQCRYNDRVISLSRHLVKANPESVVKQTILHEIAHALAGKNAGHSRVWKATAQAIGHSGSRTYDSNVVIAPERRWIGVCDGCGHKSQPRHKRGRLACARCCFRFNRGKFSPDYLLRWEER